MTENIKIFYNSTPHGFTLILISLLLCIPAILLGEWTIFFLPVILVVILSYIYGEKFIIAMVLITLFTLVGELFKSLRAVVQLADILLLTYLFAKRFGLNFTDYQRVPRSILYFLLLYFSTMIVSSLMSHFPLAGTGIIIQQMIFFVIAYMFYALINDKEVINTYIVVFFVVACILTTASLFYALSEGFSLLDVVSKNRTRVSAIITNIEAATNFYVITFPIIITVLLSKTESLHRKVYWFLLIYISLGLALAMSRSAIIGIIINTTIVLFMLRRKRFYQFSILILVIGLLFLLYEPLNEILTLFLRIEEGMSTRDYIWSMSFNIIKDYPLFGLGPGAYKYEMFNYFPYMLDDWYGKLYIYFYEITGGANLSHNFFLVFFTEMGIPGFITAVALPVIYFRIGIKTIKKYKNDSTSKYHLIIALFAAGTSIIARNIFNSIGLIYVGGIYTDLPFWLIFSSLIYFYRIPLDGSLDIHKKKNFQSQLS